MKLLLENICRLFKVVLKENLFNQVRNLREIDKKVYNNGRIIKEQCFALFISIYYLN